MLDPSFRAVSDLVAGLLVDPVPQTGLPGGALGLRDPEQALLVWAVLLADSERRPTLKSKMGPFAGLPHATLYRKLEPLLAAKVLDVDGDGRVRSHCAYLGSETLRRGIERASALVAGASRSPAAPPRRTGGGDDAGSLLRSAGPIAGLVLELARQSHCRPDPWFSAGARTWILRWLLLQAELDEARPSIALLARRIGVSRATLQRQLERLNAAAAFARELDQGLRADPTFYGCPRLQTTARFLQNKIGETWVALSELDTI